MKKILFAIADKETEDYVKTVVLEDCKNCEIIGVVTYKEKLIQKVNQLEPDILLLRENLPGTIGITDLLFELRYSYPNTRIIFLAGDRKAGDPFLVTLITYGIYDLLIGGNHKISDVIDLINIPNSFKNVNHLIPKAALNELTNSMSFESPLVVATKKNDVVVVEESLNRGKKREKFNPMPKVRQNKKSVNNENDESKFSVKSSNSMEDIVSDSSDDDFDLDFSHFLDSDKPEIDILEENDLYSDKNGQSQDDVDFDFDFDNKQDDNSKEDILDSNKDQYDEIDIDFDFDFDNEQDDNLKEDILDSNKDQYDEIDIDFDFDFDNEQDDNLKEDILDSNKDQYDEPDFDFDIEQKNTLFEEEDFMIEIDSNSLLENKNRKIDDILIEEEGEDITFAEASGNKINNESKNFDTELERINNSKVNDKKISTQSKNKKSKYCIEDIKPKDLDKEVECDLKTLTKEIEYMKEESLLGQSHENDYSQEYLKDNKYDEPNEVINNNRGAVLKKENPNTLEKKSFVPISNKSSNQSKVVVSRQKIISFIGGKNGVGTSSTAINTAVSLAKQGHRVMYIEINMIHPTIGYWYQIGHAHQGIETAVKAIESGDIQQIDKSIIKISELKKQKKKMYKQMPDNLDFLLFSKQETILNDTSHQVNPNALKDLFLYLMIDVGYNFIVLDLDFDLNNVYTTTALSFSNYIYSVITQDMSSLAYLLFKLEELEKNNKRIKSKCKYIVNRYEGNKVEINIKDLKEWLDSRDVFVIPESNREFINANTLSIPIVSYTKDEKIQKGFNDITSDILSND